MAYHCSVSTKHWKKKCPSGTIICSLLVPELYIVDKQNETEPTKENDSLISKLNAVKTRIVLNN